MMNHKVLVIIPAYNEEQTVGTIVKSTINLHPDFEVVVINDGSDDKTVQNSEKAGAGVVSLPFHCGGGAAIQAGYLLSARQSFDYTIKLDADGQHRSEDIVELLAPLLKDEADITIGSRYLGKNAEKDSAVKTGGRFFSSTLVSMLRKMEVTDITSGMRAWNRNAINALLSRYTERRVVEDSVFWVVETLLASRIGLRMKEVSIQVLPRIHGKSKSFSNVKMLMFPLRLITTLIQEAEI